MAERGGGEFAEVKPRHVASERSAPGNLDWLLAGLKGERRQRLAEADVAVGGPVLAGLPTGAGAAAAC